jgi:hypothetical protein
MVLLRRSERDRDYDRERQHCELSAGAENAASPCMIDVDQYSFHRLSRWQLVSISGCPTNRKAAGEGDLGTGRSWDSEAKQSCGRVCPRCGGSMIVIEKPPLNSSTEDPLSGEVF